MLDWQLLKYLCICHTHKLFLITAKILKFYVLLLIYVEDFSGNHFDLIFPLGCMYKIGSFVSALVKLNLE